MRIVSMISKKAYRLPPNPNFSYMLMQTKKNYLEILLGKNGVNSNLVI